jgi:hypothetical protein
VGGLQSSAAGPPLNVAMTPQMIFGINVLMGLILCVFNIVGTVDLLVAFYQGDRLGVGIAPGLQGAAYFIPTVLVPLLLVTHALVFRILLRPERVEIRHA